MIIKQLSVFVENKKGRLAEIAKKLADSDIDISALSLADTSDFGVLRLIVNKPEQGKAVLEEDGVAVKVTRVIAIVMEDVPGGASKALEAIAENNINVEYMYACIGKTTGKALMIIRTDRTDEAEAILEKNGFALVNPSDIYRI